MRLATVCFVIANECCAGSSRGLVDGAVCVDGDGMSISQQHEVTEHFCTQGLEDVLCLRVWKPVVDDVG